MSVRTAVLAVLAAGCGEPAVAMVDAAPAPDGLAAACVATFAGNFAEHATFAEPCATLRGTTLDLALPATMLDDPLRISIDLGPLPTLGGYASATTQAWSARGTRVVHHNSCVFSAGTGVIPHGSFTLTITALEAATAHGSLDAQLTILAPPFTDCGHPTSSTISLTF